MKEYQKKLDSMIKLSGLKLDEIAEKCKQRGLDITASYISKLRLGHRPAPDDNISRVIAEACGYDPHALIWAGYLEKTPIQILNKIDEYEDNIEKTRNAILKVCNEESFLKSFLDSAEGEISPKELKELFENIRLDELIETITSVGYDIQYYYSKDKEINAIIKDIDGTIFCGNMNNNYIPIKYYKITEQGKEPLPTVQIPIITQFPGAGGIDLGTSEFFNTQKKWEFKNSTSPSPDLPKISNYLSPKEERDIAHDLEKMLSDLESDNAMAFQGEPMDDDDKEMLRISLENSMRLAKQMAKKKFNPNKNKK